MSDIFAEIAKGNSYISEPDIKSLDDLNRHYPLPAGYVYGQNEAGGLIVIRSSDGAQFGFLLEDGMLGFDVPTPGKPGNKVTVEVIRQQ